MIDYEKIDKDLEIRLKAEFIRHNLAVLDEIMKSPYVDIRAFYGEKVLDDIKDILCSDDWLEKLHQKVYKG